MDSQCTQFIDAMKREKCKDEFGDIEVGEDICDEFQIQPTPALKPLDIFNCSKISSSSSSSSWICQTTLKETETKELSIGFHLFLRLPASTNQLQSLGLSLKDSETVDVIAENNSGSTALDILDAVRVPAEVEFQKINQIQAHEHKRKPADSYNKNQSDKKNRYRSETLLIDRYPALLLTATLLAALTFHAALRSPEIFSQNRTLLFKNDSDQMNHLFMLFNSVAFFGSVALITLLTYQLPVKPWLQIVLFSTIGAYICAVMVVSPQEVVTVISVGNFIWLAALFKYLGLDHILAHQMQWIYTRNRVI